MLRGPLHDEKKSSQSRKKFLQGECRPDLFGWPLGHCIMKNIYNDNIICSCDICPTLIDLDLRRSRRKLSTALDNMGVIEVTAMANVAFQDFTEANIDMEELINSSTYENTVLVWVSFLIIWGLIGFTFSLSESLKIIY